MFASTIQFDADLIGQADGNFTCLFQPALAHAILARAGVGGDTRLPIVDGNLTEAERAGYFDDLVA